MGPMYRLLELMPLAQVVLLQGGDAQQTWKSFERKHPGYAQSRGLEVISTYHPGRQALWPKDAAERERRRSTGNPRTAGLLQ